MAWDLPPTPPRAAVPRAAVAMRAAPPKITARISSFELLKVNQTTTTVPRGGTRALCQAIPFTATRVRVRWQHARAGQRLALDVRAPGHATRTRAITVARSGSGRAVVELTPRGEGLRDEAFPEGTYRFTLRHGRERLDATRFRLAAASAGKTC